MTLSARREGGQGVCICLSGRRDRAFVSFKGSVADLSEEDLDVGRLLAPGTSHLHFSAYYDCSGLQPAVPRPAACQGRLWGPGLSPLGPFPAGASADGASQGGARCDRLDCASDGRDRRVGRLWEIRGRLWEIRGGRKGGPLELV